MAVNFYKVDIGR